jgi:hypothetical protein
MGLGPRMKIGDMVDKAVASGYGKGVKRRILFNGFYTAMNRRTDMFRKVGEAEWELVGNHKSNGDHQ